MNGKQSEVCDGLYKAATMCQRKYTAGFTQKKKLMSNKKREPDDHATCRSSARIVYLACCIMDSLTFYQKNCLNNYLLTYNKT